MAGQVEHLAGEAPLVVVPGHELDEVAKMQILCIFALFSVSKSSVQIFEIRFLFSLSYQIF